MVPIKRRKLSSAVIEEIRRMIQDGELKPGDKLPDHTEFARQLQVSRTTLREAMHTLSLLGVIEQRSGYGTALTRPVPPQYERSFRFPPLQGPEAVKELLEARRVAELGTVELAAERATGEDLARMGTIVEEMRRSFQEEQMDEFVKKDLEFHLAIAQASHNRFLVRVFETLRSFTEQFMDEGFRVVPGMVKRSLDQHYRIYKAIEKKSARAALGEMKRHVAERRRVFEPLLRRMKDNGGEDGSPRRSPF